MTATPLRRHLLLLVAVAIFPVAIVSGIALYALAEHQRERAKQAGLEIARALSTAVDAELRRSLSVLEALASSDLLDAGNLAGFDAALKRVVADRPEWLSAVLHDASARMVLNSRLPFGAAMPPTAEPDTLQAVARSGRPAVGYLARGALNTYNLAVRLPVTRDGHVRYVLSAVIRPDAVRGIVLRQRLPEDWVVSVFDGRGSRVARSKQHDEFLGQGPAPSLRALMDAQSPEGTGITYSLEGDRIYTAYSRSADSGWTVAIGIPPRVADAGALRSLAVYGGGIAASILLGIVAALLLARRVTQPISSLAQAALALGRRQRVSAPPTGIAEIQAVAEALLAAGGEREKFETEREQLLRREREARGVAEAANKAKDEFLAMLGHELRNPLGAIANASRILAQPRAPAQAQALAKEVIQRQVGHLSRLTDDLLDAARVVAGKIVLQREAFDLAAEVGRIVDAFHAAGRLDAHRVERAFAPAWVDADRTRIEQIVANLLGNAVKFTPPGGTIRVSVGQRAGEALLSVADNGVGMTAEVCARAFDLFAQGQTGIDRAQGGLGIGLTLVRRLAELHGGTAEARSDGPGKGVEVAIRLPAIRAPAPTVEPRPLAAPSLAPLDIVVVDDNEDAAETLRLLLTLGGHRVRVAHDGTAALAEVLKRPPDAALIDIGLPKMDGYELARRIREQLAGRRTAISLIAVTGYGQHEDRTRALAAGFDAHLTKPVDLEALTAALARLAGLPLAS